MKNIILLTLALSFGYSPVLFANSNTIEIPTEIRKTKLCKTWYVTKAYEIRSEESKRDQTHKAQGSIFTFNKDNSFSIEDKSRLNNQLTNGTWKETGEESISITFDDMELNFDIFKLTNDSLHLIGSPKGSDKVMHIVFSTNFIKPLDKKEINRRDIENYHEIEEVEEEVVEIEDQIHEVEETEPTESRIVIPRLPQKKVVETDPTIKNNTEISTTTKSNNNSNSTQITTNKEIAKTWQLKSISVITNGKEVVYDMSMSMDFTKENEFKISEDKITQIGSWEINGEDIALTMNDKTTTFVITKSTDKEIIFSKEDEEFSVNFRYVRKN